MIHNRNRLLGKLIYDEHLRVIRQLNDMYIMIDRIIPLMQESIDKWEPMEFNDDFAFDVPSKKGEKLNTVSYRNDSEMRKLFNKYIKNELYEVFLVRSVTAFEDYLSNCISVFFYKYPEKLTTTLNGVQVVKNIEVEEIISIGDYEDILERIINKNIELLFYAEPKKYLDYFEKILSINMNDDLKYKYCEIKATRDIIIHNNGIINELYTRKAKEKARGNIGDKLKIDKEYFRYTISVFKEISGEIRKQVNEKHPIKIRK